MVKSWETRPDLANSTPWQPQGQHGLLQWQRSEKQRPGTGFLDLPRELRNMVYRYHFGHGRVMHAMYNELWPWPILDLRILRTSRTESRMWGTYQDYYPPTERTETHFLPLCKQIHYETSEMLYKNTRLDLHWEDEEDYDRIIVTRTRVHRRYLQPATYNSFIRRVSFVDTTIRTPFQVEWYQPCFIALSEHLVSAFSSLTHVDVTQDLGGYLWDHTFTRWRVLRDEKYKGENHELRLKLLNTAITQLFPKRLPAPSFMHLKLGHYFPGFWHDIKKLARELGKEFSEAFERREREINVECSSRGNRVECDDGWVLSLGYQKSIYGGYVDHYDGWGRDIDDWVDEFEEFEEFDGWAWSLEEYWDVWKDKQARKAITSPALLRKY